MKNKPLFHKLTLKQIIFLLLLFSALMYVIHYLIFRDFHHIAIFFVHDVAFLPLEVILVSLGFDRLIEKTGQEEARSKLSIIETLFFDESGGELLRYLSRFDPNASQLRAIVQVTVDWTPVDYINAKRRLNAHSFRLDVEQIDFFGLHDHLNKRHEYYLHILENPALTQSHEFTELVMKLYLLWEELHQRTDLRHLNPGEQQMLAGLLSEIYQELTEYWIDNAHNHCVHNPYRVRRLIMDNPFTE